MKEIGGYFGLDSPQINGREYYDKLISLNTARNALVYIARARKISKIYIPYLLCDSVSLVCDREGIRYGYYHTDENFRPIFNASLQDNEYLYVVNLYGQLDNNELSEMKNRHGRIIVDNIHAFFQNPIAGADTVYSCRKFFGVPDGAYLSTDMPLGVKLPSDNSEGRTNHIYGRIKDGASDHYDEFKANDKSFRDLPLMEMSEVTHRMLSHIDYVGAKKKREENYSFLHSQLGSINRLNLRIPEGPYAYPFYCENGMEVKKKLAAEKIYVATLWPNVLDYDGMLEKDYAENILPLPCDQRYGIEEMDCVVKKILRFI